MKAEAASNSLDKADKHVNHRISARESLDYPDFEVISG